jgi:RNA polymerase-binding transcription factor DksA
MGLFAGADSSVHFAEDVKMSQYHYDDWEPSEAERKEQAEREAREVAKRKKQAACKHENVDPPSGGGYGSCNDCGAII